MNLINIEEAIVRQNPHWLAGSLAATGEERDTFSHFCQELSKPKLIITLSGARRSGKTHLIHQAMQWLMTDQAVTPQNICYFQFSGSLNDRNIIQTVAELFLKKYATTGQKYLFLDEVQYVDYWQDQVKALYDAALPVKYVVTGSTSLFYGQKSKESLAGRLFKYQLGALNFREYCRFKHLPSPAADRATFISNLPIYQTEFRRYLATGQYPELVANPEIDPQKYIADLADQIINYDVPYFSAKIDRALFFDLVKTLAFDLAQEYSANSLAKTLSADRREITKYIQILTEINLFRPCYNLALKSLRKKLAGSKKIYCLNLNLALHINGFNQSYLNDTRVYGHYFENYVYLQLLAQANSVEYYRLKGKELDFVTESAAFEIKSNSTQATDPAPYQIQANQLKRPFTLINEPAAYLL